MAARITLNTLNDALLQLAQAVEECTRKNDAHWEQNDRRWEQNDRRWEQNDRRWEQNDRRLTNVEDALAGLRQTMNERFDRLEMRIAAVETK